MSRKKIENLSKQKGSTQIVTLAKWTNGHTYGEFEYEGEELFWNQTKRELVLECISGPSGKYRREVPGKDNVYTGGFIDILMSKKDVITWARTHKSFTVINFEEFYKCLKKWF